MANANKEGHRERVRKRFLEQGLEGFQDYEVLELLLFGVYKQQDTKPIAKALLARFGSFKGVLDASVEELRTVVGVGEAAAAMIHFVKHAAARYLQQASRQRSTLESEEALINYCKMNMGAKTNEVFRVIALDSSFAIIDERDIAEGTVNQATVYPRKVIEFGLASHASTLVLVHNHPSGHLEPSDFDKTMTRGLVLAVRSIELQIFDHIIVSRDGYYSFRENGLL